MRLTNERSNPQTRTAEFRFTGTHMFLSLGVFFGVIILVNFTMAILASRTWTGLVVKNSYIASQKFNDELEAARRQKQLGWQGRIRLGAHGVEFSLKDRAGRPVILDEAVLKVGRPAFEQRDAVITLAYLGDGVYQADTRLKAGPWQLSVRGSSDAVTYRLDTRINVPPPGRAGK